MRLKPHAREIGRRYATLTFSVKIKAAKHFMLRCLYLQIVTKQNNLNYLKNESI